MRRTGFSALLVAGGILFLQPALHVAAAAPSAGERAFQKCYACHSVGNEGGYTAGPPLGGIVGRRIAAQPNFDYSPAMERYAAKRKVWSRAALDAFLADPLKEAPGNEMGFFGMRDPSERKALIDWLASQ